MDTNDYLGSFAQENVSFATQVIRSIAVGDNYWKVMIFVEDDHYVDASTTDWTLVPGSTTIKGLTVTAEDYATYASGLLRSWLYDLFVSGFTGDCILIACGETVGSDESKRTAFITKMTEAYNLLKPYAYHKTVCVASDTDNAIETTVAVELAKLCADDKNLLSSVPYLPVYTSDPSTDPVYQAFHTAGTDAFLGWHTDTSRNAALFSLGVALSHINGSGTAVGEQLDFVSTGNITASNGGLNPSKDAKTLLDNAKIQYFKTVGDNTGNVAAVGYETINGTVIAAQWIICYVAYMVKVAVAKNMTTRGFWKGAASYSSILSILNTYLQKFVDSGRLTNVKNTAPAYGSITSAGDEITIPNAWEATYVDVVRKVTITGTLYIGE